MNPLFQKAVTAAASVHKLKAEQDYDGACDRAYYAMFHAARVLLTAERKVGENEPKTHHSIFRAFSEVFVLGGLVARDIGRGGETGGEGTGRKPTIRRFRPPWRTPKMPFTQWTK